MNDRPALVKCVVWDLDNTLWQGTLLENDDVVLSEAAREVITILDSRGVLHSVASKNEHDLAWERLEVLGLAEYFVIPQIGWGRKSDAVRHIADELGFAHAAIAFVDDQPAERSEVSFHLPAVRCYSPAQIPRLPGLAEFRPVTVTADARRRRQMYQAGFRRDAAREAFTGPDDDFLRSLDLELQIGAADSEQILRVEELTLRTSQMNATGVHYPDTQLRELCADPGHEVLVASLSDRFGPHGAIGVVLLGKHPSCWRIKLLATSCRVVSFGIGTAILNWLSDQAARSGVHLVADFRATGRNRMMEIAYRFAGYTETACDCASDVPGALDGVQRLHLVPGRHGPPATLSLRAPAISALPARASS